MVGRLVSAPAESVDSFSEQTVVRDRPVTKRASDSPSPAGGPTDLRRRWGAHNEPTSGPVKIAPRISRSTKLMQDLMVSVPPTQPDTQAMNYSERDEDRSGDEKAPQLFIEASVKMQVMHTFWFKHVIIVFSRV
jgi:hypothetical protein